MRHLGFILLLLTSLVSPVVGEPNCNPYFPPPVTSLWFLVRQCGTRNTFACRWNKGQLWTVGTVNGVPWLTQRLLKTHSGGRPCTGREVEFFTVAPARGATVAHVTLWQMVDRLFVGRGPQEAFLARVPHAKVKAAYRKQAEYWLGRKLADDEWAAAAAVLDDQEAREITAGLPVFAMFWHDGS